MGTINEGERIIITHGMKLPKKFAEAMEELQSESEGVDLIMHSLIMVASQNRRKMRSLWNNIEKEFDLDGKRWRTTFSPKTNMEWVFEEPDSHSMMGEGEPE